MGEPENPGEFVKLEADDLKFFVARGTWEGLKPRQSKLLIAVPGYGRFWLYLERTSDSCQEGQRVD